MNIFDLAAVLTLNKDDYDKGLKDAEGKAEGFGGKLGNAAKIGAAGIAAVGTAAVSAGTSLVKATGEVADYGDNIDKLSQQMGISATAYQEWDAVMQHSGASIESLKPAMKTLANQAQEGSDAFERLGISQEEVANLSQEDLFGRVVEGLQGMEEGTERTAIASKLLGRGATELGALFNTSAEETQAMKDRVHELGGVMSDEAVKAAAKYNDTLQDMQTAFSGLKRNLMGEFMPGITGVMSGLTEIFAGNNTEGIGMITEGITSVVNKVTELLPTVLEVGSQIIMGLAEAIVENLPTLMETAVSVVMQLATGLVDNLPTIIETGLQVILALITGITESLPQLIPAVVNAVLMIAKILTQPDTLMQILEAGITLLLELVKAIGQAIPDIVAALPQIIANIVSFIIQSLPEILAVGAQLIGSFIEGLLSKLEDVKGAASDLLSGIWDKIKEKIDAAKDWGKDLIDNFVSGIKEKFEDIREAFHKIGELIKSLIGFSEPEEGPLANFHTYAPDMIDLFSAGIVGNEDKLKNTVSKAFDFDGSFTVPSATSSQLTAGGKTSAEWLQAVEADLVNVWTWVQETNALLVPYFKEGSPIKTQAEISNIRDLELAAYG